MSRAVSVTWASLRAIELHQFKSAIFIIKFVPPLPNSVFSQGVSSLIYIYSMYIHSTYVFILHMLILITVIILIN
jgi:hypothetical protein